MELNFRRDLRRLTWRYEESLNVHVRASEIESGQYGFEVHGNQLRLEGGIGPEALADIVLGRFIRDCAFDSADRRPR